MSRLQIRSATFPYSERYQYEDVRSKSRCGPGRRQVLSLVACLLVAGLAACNRTPPITLHGNLYFAAGPYLGVLRLSDGEVRALQNFGDWRIGHVSVYPGDELLLSLSRVVDDRRRDRLGRLNTATGQEVPLVAGSSGQYIPGADSLVYVSNNRLLHAPRAALGRTSVGIQDFGVGSLPRAVLLGESEVLLASGDNMLRRFDATSGLVQNVDRFAAVCDWRTAIAISGRGRVVCVRPGGAAGESSLVIFSLDTARSTHLPLPAGRRFRPVAYVPEPGALILSESRRRWSIGRNEYPVWAYVLETGALHLIADDQDLGQTVVYRR